jgi:hypothetical protein
MRTFYLKWADEREGSRAENKRGGKNPAAEVPVPGLGFQVLVFQVLVF